MTKRILIMGLPGSGKTTIARMILDKLHDEQIRVGWLNADIVRQQFDDWDFSYEGRLRQSKRMRQLSEQMNVDCAIADFVCPIKDTFDAYDADIVIWMDTIDKGRYEDTNAMFEPPSRFDYRLTEYADDSMLYNIVGHILQKVK